MKTTEPFARDLKPETRAKLERFFSPEQISIRRKEEKQALWLLIGSMIVLGAAGIISGCLV